MSYSASLPANVRYAMTRSDTLDIHIEQTAAGFSVTVTTDFGEHRAVADDAAVALGMALGEIWL